MLFLLHINDLPANVTSRVRLFADDCLLYRPIHGEADQQALQNDLNALIKWCKIWGMKFNASKCVVMRIARKKTRMERMYDIEGVILQEVTQAKYLGVTISNNLEWSNHVTAVSNKANNILAFLRRNLKGAPPKLKETAYLSLARPILEYGAAVWDPRLCKDINALEMVQRRAARFVKQDYQRTSSVTAMLDDLGWEPLAARRRDIRLTLLYKIINNEATVPTEDTLIPADSRTRTNHKLKFKTIQSNSPAYRNSFFVKTIPQWNNLKETTIESPSVKSFKSHLKDDTTH